ncbi:cellulase family glycosylhydrolase [Fibrobacter succinogenes]|uniref:cellulase family glycosylhydrolase n=1 Tax=Fibrobacter succinogenes TaxID=833 RepID=UPI0015661FF2|nr:cellulase family glycosylhydrolase [Fibrobacter succinogenes]
MKKVLAILGLAAVSAMAISANRIGPVSTYGELKANGGKLSGTCPQYANSAVQVKGMSLFWSSAADSATAFYTEKAVNLMVKDMKIEVIRFAMGVKNEDFDKGRGYLTGGEDLQKAYLKNIVNAAIENDIYVIIDWHIESGNGYTSDAVKFFEYAAQQYGSYNNVIFEVWNEPKDGASMGTVASHANSVINAIRKYSDNLVLIGSPEWSSHPEECASASISDSKKNYACTLHFYADSHSANGDYANRANQALGKNVPVFASEWGTVNANGNGGANQSASQAWINWMNDKKVSWANWSASGVNEGSAAFNKINLDNGLSYSNSGNMVKGWMNKNMTYSDCGLENGNSSSQSGFSTGIANGTKTDMIDDMEDNDRYAYTGGFWSAWTDANENGDNGVGQSSISNGTWENDFGKTVYDVLLPKEGSKNTSNYMVGLKKIKLARGTYQYAPYVDLGLNLTKDTAEFDMSACKSISYKFKGASHNFRLETSLVTNWNFHHVNKDASDEWKEVELTWDQFNQEDWGDNDKHFNLKDKGLSKVKRLAWEVKGVQNVPDNQNQPSLDYLFVDDVRCDGLSITAISGKIAAPTSSSAAKSSSSVTPPSSSSSVVVPPASSSSVVITDLLVIDDVEDGNEVLNTTGTWYAYTDNESLGKSSITNVYDPNLPGYVVVFPGSADPTNGTQGFVGLTGIHWDEGDYAYDPFVALGLNTNADTSLGIDLSNCPVISYRYKGAAHTIKLQDGQVTDFAFHNRKLLDAGDWTLVNFKQEEFKQPSWTQTKVDLNWSNIKKISWEVIGAKGYTDTFQPEFDYLYIDDLKCVDQAIGIKSIVRTATGLRIAAKGHDLNIMTSKSGLVKVQVFDMTGHTVKSVSENMQAGTHTVSLENLTAGSYIVRVQAGNAKKSARITLK